MKKVLDKSQNTMDTGFLIFSNNYLMLEIHNLYLVRQFGVLPNQEEGQTSINSTLFTFKLQEVYLNNFRKNLHCDHKVKSTITWFHKIYPKTFHNWNLQ